MPWEDFREAYRRDYLQSPDMREKSAIHAESRLDIAERIAKPRTLGDMAKVETLQELQRQLIAGAGRVASKAKSKSKRRRPADLPRAPMTVHNYMGSVIAALNWAAADERKWLPAVPKIRKPKTAKLRQMKGRPITAEEFERMLDKTEEVVGKVAAPSWKYILRGLWESSLRLGELMHVHWTDANYILPVWRKGALPVLSIPHDMQKNETEESIPMLPGFESVLLETPQAERTGWAFNPQSLQTKLGRSVRHGRPNAEWVGKVISEIGEKAGVIVQPARGQAPAKFASAHDLRRSCADRLVDAGVPERELAAVMRHASVETTRRHYAPVKVQRTAGVIRETLLAVVNRT
jgi:integrase